MLLIGLLTMKPLLQPQVMSPSLKNFDIDNWQGRVNIKNSSLFNKHISNSVLEIYGFSQNQADGGIELIVSGDGFQVGHIKVNFNQFSFAKPKAKISRNGAQR